MSVLRPSPSVAQHPGVAGATSSPPTLMGWPRRVLPLALALGTLLVLPAAAPAAEVTRLSGSNNVGIFADVGELNDVTIGHDGSNHTFTDTSATLIATPPCSQVTPNEVSCPSAPDDRVLAFVGDRDDRVTATTTPFPAAVCGGLGDDVVLTGSGPDGVFGEEGNDIIRAGDGRDLVMTEDRCSGPSTVPPGEDTVDGEAGADILQGSAGRDTLSGGPGNDTLLALAGDDSLDGGGDDDELMGFEGDDVLSGGDGFDSLGGGAGDDSAAGGSGNDVLGVTFADDGVVHPDDGDDFMAGGDGNDTLTAGPGSSLRVFGEPDVDPFVSDLSNGADQFGGGAGTDTVTYANRSAAVAVTKDGLANDGSAEERDNVHTDVEAVTGGSGADTLLGGSDRDLLDGGRGSDELHGGLGDDSLTGGAEDGGADRLMGGAGADSLQGNAGRDSLRGGPDGDTLAGGGGSDTIAGEDGADDITGGTGLDSISGGAGDDRLDGSQALLVGADSADTLAGDEGNDTLLGGAGDDTLSGGPGMDSLSGGDGAGDVADYSGARRRVSVSLDDTSNDGEAGESDNVHSDVEGIRGGAAEDSFSGGGASNRIEGGAGEDFLDGGPGVDDLRGGKARDAIRARDGGLDVVRCGAGVDFAIADREDMVFDCERVDRGGRRQPVLGKLAILRPLAGTLKLRLPGTERSIPLRDTLRVPLGFTVDAGSGKVRLTVAADRRGRKRAAVLRGGRFVAHQRRRRNGLTELTVLRTERETCGSDGDVLGRLRARAGSGFRTRGQHASALGRRASWVTENRCGGTLVRALRGRVQVVVHREGERRVVLRAGRSHFARAS
jgi:Ca2+-binding RTX toxin-like protein